MNELQRHLQTQRDHALRLILSHNQILSKAFGQRRVVDDVDQPELLASELSPASNVDSGVKTVTKGNVISLFEYANDKQSSPEEVKSSDSKNIIFKEDDPAALEIWGDTVNGLLAEYGGDDALAIHRKILAGSIFMNSSKDAFYFHECANGVMMALCYVGPIEKYGDTLSELIAYSDANDLVINIMAQEDKVEALTAHGLSTTPIGIWQRIEPIDEFTTAGSRMRRLRYLVSKYKKTGDVKMVQYVPGTTTTVDEEICGVIDEWVEIKEVDPHFVPELKKQVRAGTVSSNHQFYLTYRDNKLDNVIILSIDNLNDGYLMDAEFYTKDMPLGGTEFAITEMMELFKQEGKKVFSLGLTLGTGLYEHENRSQEVHDLYAVLKKTEFVNGDANAQYKNKYRPTSISVYLARPVGIGSKRLNDLMIMMGQG